MERLFHILVHLYQDCCSTFLEHIMMQGYIPVCIATFVLLVNNMFCMTPWTVESAMLSVLPLPVIGTLLQKIIVREALLRVSYNR